MVSHEEFKDVKGLVYHITRPEAQQAWEGEGEEIGGRRRAVPSRRPIKVEDSAVLKAHALSQQTQVGLPGESLLPVSLDESRRVREVSRCCE